MKIEGSQILITGGAGFVGSHIADLALQAGARRVIAIDNLVTGTRVMKSTSVSSSARRAIRGRPR